jgi:hypothetical protein
VLDSTTFVEYRTRGKNKKRFRSKETYVTPVVWVYSHKDAKFFDEPDFVVDCRNSEHHHLLMDHCIPYHPASFAESLDVTMFEVSEEVFGSYFLNSVIRETVTTKTRRYKTTINNTVIDSKLMLSFLSYIENSDGFLVVDYANQVVNCLEKECYNGCNFQTALSYEFDNSVFNVNLIRLFMTDVCGVVLSEAVVSCKTKEKLKLMAINEFILFVSDWSLPKIK